MEYNYLMELVFFCFSNNSFEEFEAGINDYYQNKKQKEEEQKKIELVTIEEIETKNNEIEKEEIKQEEIKQIEQTIQQENETTDLEEQEEEQEEIEDENIHETPKQLPYKPKNKPKKSSDEDNIIYFAIGGVVLLIAIIGSIYHFHKKKTEEQDKKRSQLEEEKKDNAPKTNDFNKRDQVPQTIPQIIPQIIPQTIVEEPRTNLETEQNLQELSYGIERFKNYNKEHLDSFKQSILNTIQHDQTTKTRELNKNLGQNAVKKTAITTNNLSKHLEEFFNNKSINFFHLHFNFKNNIPNHFGDSQTVGKFENIFKNYVAGSEHPFTTEIKQKKNNECCYLVQCFLLIKQTDFVVLLETKNELANKFSEPVTPKEEKKYLLNNTCFFLASDVYYNLTKEYNGIFIFISDNQEKIKQFQEQFVNLIPSLKIKTENISSLTTTKTQKYTDEEKTILQKMFVVAENNLNESVNEDKEIMICLAQVCSHIGKFIRDV